MSFQESLETGRIGEGEVARWFNKIGYNVLPAYEIEVNHGKGPRLYCPSGALISPDLLVFNKQRTLWIEAKTKSAFTWHRLTNSFQTGLDKRHWLDYIRVAEVTPFPVWILFLHRKGFKAKDTPENMQSPSGLFGNEIRRLEKLVDHESDRHGPSGMVYWRESSLLKFEDL